jgi:hypothetical protein
MDDLSLVGQIQKQESGCEQSGPKGIDLIDLASECSAGRDFFE